jgi:transcriptional regulator with XRE-family HTH domain
MAARKKARKRASLPEISVEYEQLGQLEESFGPDLNEAARAAIQKFGEDAGITSKAELAKRVGIRAPSLAMLLSGEQGMRVDVLSRVCAALAMTPGQFFALGGAHVDSEAQGADAELMDSFRRHIPQASRERIFELALLASSTKFADEALDAALTFVRAVASQNGADIAAMKRAAKDLAKRV